MSGATKLMTAGGGGVSLTPASSIASDVTVNVPSVNGTLVSTGSTAQVSQAMLAAGVAGNGPAFSAYVGVDQTVTTGTWTKLSCSTEEFDTASCYDNTTNYRFTPTVAGYYQVNGQVSCSSSSTITLAICNLYKNGSGFKNGVYTTSSGSATRVVLSTLVYLNGSTDYLEFYGRIDGAGTLKFLGNNNNDSYFQASLVRAA